MGLDDRKKREKKRLAQLRINQIQHAAQEVFIDKGFNSATIEDIAKKAELSPATIYIYFKNKYELYASLNLLTLQYMHTEIENIYINKGLSIIEKMFGFKDAMYKTLQYNPITLRLIFLVQLHEELPSLNIKIVDKINRLSNKVMSMIANIYEEGVQKGIFDKGHPMAHADIIWSLFSGLVLWEGAKKQLNPKKDFLKPTLDRAFDIFIKGIMKDPQEKTTPSS